MISYCFVFKLEFGKKNKKLVTISKNHLTQSTIKIHSNRDKLSP